MRRLHRFFFYLLIVFLPTQLGLHLWPEWSLVLGRRIDYLSPTLFFTDILIIFIIGIWGIEQRKKFSIFEFHLSHACIGIFIGLNIYFSLQWQVAMITWLKVLEFFLLGFYIVKEKPSLFLISGLLACSVLYSSLLAIAQFVLQHSVGGIFWWLGERTFSADTPGIAQYYWRTLFLRPYATFPHPNVLGGYIAALFPLILIQYHQSTKKLLRILYGSTIVVGFIALVLTFSRSAWLAGFIGIGWCMFSNKKLFAIYVALIGGIFLLMIPPQTESVIVRQQLVISAIQIWKSAPLVGVGLGNFLVALPSFLPSKLIYFLQPVHNIYLLLLSETGIAGAIIVLSFLYYLVRRKKKYSKSNIFYVIPIVIVLILGLFDHYPLSLQQGRLLLTLCIAFLLM